MNTYSKILSEALGFKWNTKVFCVHHLNHDHKDNRVENLVLLPKKMHQQYHFWFNSSIPGENCVFNKGVNLNIIHLSDSIVNLIEIKVDMATVIMAERNLIANRKRFGIQYSEKEAFDFMWYQAGHIISKYL